MADEPETPESRVLLAPHLSVTQITMYLRCSMQYWFRYIQNVIAPPNLALANGKAGHSGLEHDNITKIATGSPAPVADVLDIAVTELTALSSFIPDLNPTDLDSTKDKLTATLQVYMAGTGALGPMPTAAEEEFWMDVPGTDPVLGFIDVQNDVGLFDYKFTTRAKTQDAADMSLQLSVYDIATAHQARNLGFISLLPPTTRSEPKVIFTTRNTALMAPALRAHRAARTFVQIQNVSRAIAAKVFTPVDDERICSWCGYRQACQGLQPTEFPKGME